MTVGKKDTPDEIIELPKKKQDQSRGGGEASKASRRRAVEAAAVASGVGSSALSGVVSFGSSAFWEFRVSAVCARTAKPWAKLKPRRLGAAEVSKIASFLAPPCTFPSSHPSYTYVCCALLTGRRDESVARICNISAWIPLRKFPSNPHPLPRLARCKWNKVRALPNPRRNVAPELPELWTRSEAKRNRSR